jgi:hypothetical protein
MGLRFDVASDQLSAQPQSRSNSEKKTSHNIEKHLYDFDINWDCLNRIRSNRSYLLTFWKITRSNKLKLMETSMGLTMRVR